MSVKDAFLKYSSKQLKKNNSRTPKKRNAKPEEISVKEVLEWCKEYGFSVHRVESKAVYSASAGRYLHGQTVSGFPDVVGCTAEGMGAFIEVKAKGKLSTVRPGQVVFLDEKIRKGSFAVVVDSGNLLNNYFAIWTGLESVENKKHYLRSILPKRDKFL